MQDPKKALEEWQQKYFGGSAALERSGLERDAFDSRARESYEKKLLDEAAARRAATEGGFYVPTAAEQAAAQRRQNSAALYAALLAERQPEMERQAQALDAAGQELDRLAEMARQGNRFAALLYGEKQESYRQQYGAYEQAYRPLYEGYGKAAQAAQESARREAERQESARKEGEVQAELDGVDRQIAGLEKARDALRRAKAQKLTQIYGAARDFRGPLDLATPELDGQIAELEGQIAALTGQWRTLDAELTASRAKAEAARKERLAGLDTGTAETELRGTEQEREEARADYERAFGFGFGTARTLGDAPEEQEERREAAADRMNGTEARYRGQFADLRDAKYLQADAAYKALRERADFAEKSAWDRSADDPAGLYFEVNHGGVQGARLTEEERSTFNYLWNTQGGTAAEAYLEHMQGELNRRRREAWTERTQSWAEKHPALASAASVAAAPLKAISRLGQWADYLDGDWQIDRNAAYNAPVWLQSAVRQTVASRWGGAGSFLYQTGMSMFDFLFNTAITGGNASLALAVMGTEAAADETARALDRGLTGGQAMALGSIAGMAEVLTERVSIEALFSQEWEESIGRYLVKNILAEGSEEGASDLINLAADLLIARDKSQWREAIDTYRRQGKTEREAFRAALLDQVREIGLDMAGGALSGGVMAGSNAAVSTGLRHGSTAAQRGRALREDGRAEALIDTALGELRHTRAGQLAAELQEEYARGRTDDYRLGLLAQLAAQETGRDAGGETGGAVPPGNENAAPGTGTAEKPRISMEEYANSQAPIWNNVPYEDTETKSRLMQEKHTEMVDAGRIVNVPEETLDKVSQSYPDLRGMKKTERLPILKAKIDQLKASLREALTGLKGAYEFEVNGKTLEARLYDTGVAEVMRSITQPKASMLFSSGDIFRNAEYLYSTPDRDSDANVYRWNYFYTPVRIGSDVVGVRIAVRDMANPTESQVYNWGIKKDAALGGAGREKNRIPSGASSAASSGKGPQSEHYNAGDIADPAHNAQSVPTQSSFQTDHSITQEGNPVNSRETQGKESAAGERTGGVRLPKPGESGRLPTGVQYERERLAARAKTELERTGILCGVQENVIARVERLCRLLGAEAVFYSEGGANGVIENGYYDRTDGRIHLNAQSKNPAAQVLIHELTHRLEGSEAYGRLSRAILDQLGEEELARQREEITARYAKRGTQLTAEGADKEIVARYAERRLLTDEAAIRDAVRQERSFGRWMLEQLDRLLARLGNEMARERTFLADARRMYAAALEAGTEQSGEGREYSISRTREMPWETQVQEYFKPNGSIRSSDSLYLGTSGAGLAGKNQSIPDAPLYLPLSVITKGMKGEDASHSLREGDISRLKQAIESSPAVIYNPARNALVYVTDQRATSGGYIIATFDLNHDLYGENAHKARSIHTRESISGLLNNLGSDAVIYVRDRNRLNQMLPGTGKQYSQLLAQVEPINESITKTGPKVNPEKSGEIRKIDEAPPAGDVPSAVSGGARTEPSNASKTYYTPENQKVNPEKSGEARREAAVQHSYSRTAEEQEGVLEQLRGYLAGRVSRAELARYVDAIDGRERAAQPEETGSEAQEIVTAAHREGASVEEYLRRNWERYEYDGELNGTAREALALERSGRQHSYSEEEITGPLRTYLPGNERARVDRAREMLDNGATRNEVYNETGIVVMANGELLSGFGGKAIGRYEDGKAGQRGVQRTGAESIDEVGQGRILRAGEGAIGNRIHPAGDGQKLGTDAAKQSGAGRSSWQELGERTRSTITAKLAEHMDQANREGEDLLIALGGDEAMAERFYSMLQEGRVVAEQWSYFIPDIQGLMDEVDQLLTDQQTPERQHSYSEEWLAEQQANLDEVWAAVHEQAARPAEEAATRPEELVSAGRPKERRNFREAAEDTRSFLARKLVDAGDQVKRIGRTLGDRYLYAYYNLARASISAGAGMIEDGQTDIYGRRTGKSLNAIFDPIRAQGDEYYEAFQLYLDHMHNVDRMQRENRADAEAAAEEFRSYRASVPELLAYDDEQIREMALDGQSEYHRQAARYVELMERARKARNTRNKPVFGWDVTAEKSRAAAAELARQHPEFEELAREVYGYIDNLMRYRVDSGLITQDEYARLKAIYPHYVPTYRDGAQSAGQYRTDQVMIGRTVGRAVGGSEPLTPLHEALARQTLSVVREGSKNRFGQRLLELGAQKDERTAKHVRKVQEYEGGFSEDTFDQQDEAPRRSNTFVVLRDGKRYEMTVSPALFEAVEALSAKGQEENAFLSATRKANDLFKSLVTSKNPAFLVKNFLRDLQDAGLNSKDLSEFAKHYPKAVKEIVTGGEYWQRYRALGGVYYSFFNMATGETEKRSAAYQKTVGWIEALNEGVEQAPRLAEFMATVDKAGGLEQADMDTLMEAMYNAAEVTVNFGRAGTWSKFLNTYLIPFWNPGIQGFDKMIRNVTETRGARDWLRLAVKAAALGVAPRVINGLLYRDDEDWKEISDSVKDAYYLFKIGDGVWLRLPKGRVLSVIGTAADRAADLARGEKVDWREFIQFVGSQTAPSDPFSNNIFANWVRADLFDRESPGKTWYGGDIESQRLRSLAPGERYDARTDKVSKWLGAHTGLSPKKINYLLDQYTGVIGDFLLPAITPAAERGMLSAAFTLDSTASNRLSGEFYGKRDELTYAKNRPGRTGADMAVYRYWNKQEDLVGEVNAAIREIEADETLSGGDKRELLRAQYQIRNALERAALDSFEDYAEAAERYYTQSADLEDEDARTELAYRMANRDVLGAEYALRVYSRDVYEKARELEGQGVSYEETFRAYFAAKDAAAGLTGAAANEAKRKAMLDCGLDDRKTVLLYQTYNGAVNTHAEDFREASLSEESLYRLAAELLRLVPQDGSGQVTSLQKYRAVVDAGLSEQEQRGALSVLMPETEYQKLEAGRGFGVTPAAYVAFREALPDYDADGSGTYTQAEVKAALDSFGMTRLTLPGAGNRRSVQLTRDQKAALWQLANKSWKPENNPYSAAVGRRVLNATGAAGGAQTAGGGGIRLPTGASGGLTLPTGSGSGSLRPPAASSGRVVLPTGTEGASGRIVLPRA